MRSRRLPGLLSLTALLALAAPAPARADDEAPRRLTATIDSGVMLPDDHLHQTGVVSVPQPLYLGLTLDWALAARVHAQANVGADLVLGWMVGGSVRYVALDRGGFILSAGAGPVLTPDAPYGSGVFAKGDVSAQVRLRSGFAVVLDAGVAWSLSQDGSKSCGIDICGAYLERGDRIASVLVSLGYAFPL